MSPEISQQAELASCPFCAWPDVHTAHTAAGGLQWWQVVCPGCMIDGPSAPTEAEAIAAWNTRQPSDGYMRGVEDAAKVAVAEYERNAATVRATKGDDDLAAHGCWVAGNIRNAIRKLGGGE